MVFPIRDSTNLDNSMVTQGRSIDSLSADEKEDEPKRFVPVAKGARLYCPNCGNEVNPLDRKCSKCGKEFEWNEKHK